MATKGKNRNRAPGSSGEESQGQLPLVLVVEDEDDYLWLISSGLTDDYSVIEARDGKEGLEKAVEHVPDLVLTDLMMPVMDGVELCRRLKANVETSHIPVIMLTAKSAVEDQVEGLESGADDYVTKPFNMLLLKTRIQNLLDTRRLLRERFSQGLKSSDGSPAGRTLDQEFLDKAFGVLEAECVKHDFTAEQFAQELNMSLRSLHRKLKALTDETPAKLIWNTRLKRAAELLRSTDLNITRIAYDVGYIESSHFSRQFREHFGMSPSEYRLAGVQP